MSFFFSFFFCRHKHFQQALYLMDARSGRGFNKHLQLCEKWQEQVFFSPLTDLGTGLTLMIDYSFSFPNVFAEYSCHDNRLFLQSRIAPEFSVGQTDFMVS